MTSYDAKAQVAGRDDIYPMAIRRGGGTPKMNYFKLQYGSEISCLLLCVSGLIYFKLNLVSQERDLTSGQHEEIQISLLTTLSVDFNR